MTNFIKFLITSAIFVSSCTPDPAVPAIPVTPSNLTVQIDSANKFTLSWIDNSTNESGFKIERKVRNGSWELIGTVVSDTETFINKQNILFITPCTYRVYSYNSGGKSPTYSNEVIINSVIGSHYQGGIVAYVDTVSSQHGLIANRNMKTTNPVFLLWGCSGNPITGANGTAYGTGNQNTIDILNGCPTAPAAKYCSDLVLNGYSDWFLPSLNELLEIYKNRYTLNIHVLITTFGDPYYCFWTSSQGSNNDASVIYFGEQSLVTGPAYSKKNLLCNVIAVRSF